MMDNFHVYIKVVRHVFWAALILIACLYSLKLLVHKTKTSLFDVLSIVVFCAVNIAKKICYAALENKFTLQKLDGFTYFEKMYRTTQLWDFLIIISFVVLLIRTVYKTSNRIATV